MNSITRKLVSCALCIALGVLLPMAFHVIPNAGSVFLPMHIPVLICGLFCGWPYGLACGILTPFISSVTTGMPPAMMLPQMMVELAVYGLVAGLCEKYNPQKKAENCQIRKIHGWQTNPAHHIPVICCNLPDYKDMHAHILLLPHPNRRGPNEE